MIQTFVAMVQSLPDEFFVTFLAAMPVVELRAAIPVAISVYHFSPVQAFVWSVIGNLIPLLFLFPLLPKAITWLSNRSPKIHQILERYFFRLSKKHGPALNRFGMFSLAVFVAIPYPGTGAWTAAILAILFRMNPRYAIPAIICGVITAGIIVVFLTEASIKLF